MAPASWQNAQRSHYDTRDHRHLLASEGGAYAANLVEHLWHILAAANDAEGLEVGCGSGRFTLPLLSHCAGIDAVDISPRQLAQLGEALQRAGVDPSRCRSREGNLEDPHLLVPSGRYDFITGFFILHHLADPEGAVRRLVPALRPGGRLAFLEPNRRNPSFLLQIACCPDMTWREERGTFRLGAARMRRVLEAAGLHDVRVDYFGAFPPQVVNRVPRVLALEQRLERFAWIRPILPFAVVSGTAPAPLGN